MPVKFVLFDLLYQDGELLLDEPLVERRRRLEQLLAPAQSKKLQIAPERMCRTREALEEAFRAALAAGHEGIVAKAPDSLYTPGRRGRFWFKLKEPFATLDVVVTAVEYGHGKRHGPSISANSANPSGQDAGADRYPRARPRTLCQANHPPAFGERRPGRRFGHWGVILRGKQRYDPCADFEQTR